MQGLSQDEMLRYQRHLSLPGFGPDAQSKLKQSGVLVIGAGGLGCPVLLYLAAAGVGRIGIIDGDTVDLSNLQRQVLYTADDIGRSKAAVAAEKTKLAAEVDKLKYQVTHLKKTLDEMEKGGAAAPATSAQPAAVGVPVGHTSFSWGV